MSKVIFKVTTQEHSRFQYSQKEKFLDEHELDTILGNNHSAKDSPFQSARPTIEKARFCLAVMCTKGTIRKPRLSRAERATTQNSHGSAAEVSKISRSEAQRDRQIKEIIRYKILCWRGSQWSTSSI